MKKYIFSSALMVSLGLMAVGCNDDKEEDTVKPEVVEVSIDGEDHDIAVSAGTNMAVGATVSDNEDLGELKIDIHDVFDGHSHKSSAKWAEVRIVELSGTKQTVEESIAVPVDATAGPYHCVVRVIDEAGNESDFEELEFMLSNGSEPMFNITNPDFSSEVHAPKGSTVSIEGTITDDIDLAEVYIVLEEEHDHGHDHKSTQEEPIYEMDFDLDGSVDLSWDFQADGNVNIAIPTDAEEGHYALIIRAEDSEGNINIFEAELHIM